jgi:hypothetical protein
LRLAICLTVIDLDQYDFIKGPENYYYEFYSRGPKGQIKKVVEFYKIHPRVFNIAFGDWNEKGRRINDTSKSNNNDTNKVLATKNGKPLKNAKIMKPFC